MAITNAAAATRPEASRSEFDRIVTERRLFVERAAALGHETLMSRLEIERLTGELEAERARLTQRVLALENELRKAFDDINAARGEVLALKRSRLLRLGRKVRIVLGLPTWN